MAGEFFKVLGKVCLKTEAFRAWRVLLFSCHGYARKIINYGKNQGAVLDVALRVELDPLFEGAQEVAR